MTRPSLHRSPERWTLSLNPRLGLCTKVSNTQLPSLNRNPTRRGGYD